jgi:glycosyltransferase involved in cell wall biosynthesis
VFVPSKLLPHKNLELTVHVAARLQQIALHPLILISGATSPHEPTTSVALAQRLETLARDLGASAAHYQLPAIIGATPERRTIRDLMLLSDLVFLPSAEEGFGMPIQEAAALRTPVLCSDIPPFREVGGSYACYVPLDATPEAIACRIMEVATSPVNQARRQAVCSSVRFRIQLQDLLTVGT